MNTPFSTFDAKAMMKQLGELNTKLIKGSGFLSEIDNIDVGTAPKDIVYEEDKLKLYHYKPEADKAIGVPVLIVYALVNRPYMLDIQPDRSFIRNLLKLGLDIYLIDWGYPAQADRYLSMDDYINGYIDNCVDVIRKKTKVEKVTLMGVCQGGTFSAIYSALHPEKVQNLVTLVAPFDFTTNDGLLFSWSKTMDVDALVDAYGVVPGTILNEGFLMLMPFNLNIKKYVDMLDVMEDKDKLLNFLRMEKWIFDSPGQAGECLRQFVKDCYQENKLIKGKLELGGKTVNLKNISMPILNIYASADHLVPPAATKPLNDFVGSDDKTLYEFKGGHIGVFVGSRSQKELAPAIADWLTKRDLPTPSKTTSKSVSKTLNEKQDAPTNVNKPAIKKQAK
ncbi:MAG TPA: class III poly(R)-hydroxyalkanoic acid synthase subunit PhaC [Methylophilaceae bacterium]|nr:class III poly(R)-hydroxyalkanoic acid synthase subunit PhaC [Methylophilaceae bacterium]